MLAVGVAFVLGLNAGEFIVDIARSSVDFKTKHLLISNVGGSFKNFNGKVDIDSRSKKINFLEGEISIGSISTDNQKRDDYLKSPDFFNERKNPKGFFKMTRQDDDKVWGILTLNGNKQRNCFGR